LPLGWWEATQFKPMQSTFSALWEATLDFDFGLFILTPDDTIESRGETNLSARDNVLFELGLFLGRLGSERTFAVVQGDPDPQKKVKVLSDLAGITIPRFEVHENEIARTAHIRNAASEISRVILKMGRKMSEVKPAQSWGYDSVEGVFNVTLSDRILAQNLAEFRNKKLALVATKDDDEVSPEDDERLAFGSIRKVPNPLVNDLPLRVRVRDALNVKAGDRIWAHLMLVPQNYDIRTARTISQMVDEGCDPLQSLGRRVSPSQENNQSTGVEASRIGE